jgi:enoyl-[acyl-carrier protein] reductase III
MTHLAGKIVIVTGSGRGIGRAIALYFASAGASVVVNCHRNRAQAEAVAAEIHTLGGEAIVVRANVGDPDDLQRLFAETVGAFGGVDILIHNAASGYNRPIAEQRAKGWDWTMNINARALLLAAQHAADLMRSRGGGSIVALSSMGAWRVMPDYVTVGASKAAVESLVRYLAVELAPDNIRVNAVAPGLVETDALDHFAVFHDSERDMVGQMRRETPAGRLCTPEDVAGVVAFLCSPAAYMIRGQTVTMDGGYALLA